jgi:trimeric autotransporter adhesin
MGAIEAPGVLVTIRAERALTTLRKTPASIFRLGSAFLLASLFAACAYAQDPLSSSLAPMLTDNPETAPVTTLSIDLLAPQRPFIFDPTGAAVSGNGLDPSIYSSTLASSLAQTDTEIRDSSQTGQVSPYAQAAKRLGINFSGSGNSSADGSRNISSGATNMQHGGSSSSYQSSWGSSSSFGSRSGESSWRAGSMPVDTLAQNQPGSYTSSSDPNGESTNSAPSSGYGYTSGVSNRSTGSSTSRNSTRRATGYEPSSSRTSTVSSTTGSTTPSESGTRPGEIRPVGTASGGASGNAMSRNSTGAANGLSADNTSSSIHSLTFFSPAYAGQAPLGFSPFSSPTPAGELHFLNPDIYAATSSGRARSSGALSSSSHSASSTRGDIATQENSLRQEFVPRHSMEATAGHNRLLDHSITRHSATRLSERSKGLRRNRLTENILDSDNPPDKP